MGYIGTICSDLAYGVRTYAPRPVKPCPQLEEDAVLATA